MNVQCMTRWLWWCTCGVKGGGGGGGGEGEEEEKKRRAIDGKSAQIDRFCKK